MQNQGYPPGPGGYPPGYPPPGYPPHGYGQPPPPPPPKKAIGAGGIIAIIAGMCLACMVVGKVSRDHREGAGNSSSGSSLAARQYIPQGCAEVAHLFGPQSRMTDLQLDELWHQYDDHWVRWTATVSHIDQSAFGGISVQFRCSTESLIFDGQARFSDASRQGLLALQQGSTFTFTGRLTDHGRLLGMTISDAELTQ